MFNDKKARAKKLHGIINANKVDFFTLNQVQAVVASYLATIVVFPKIQDQSDERINDIIAGVVTIGILSGGNLAADIYARIKDKKKLEHILRRVRSKEELIYCN